MLSLHVESDQRTDLHTRLESLWFEGVKEEEDDDDDDEVMSDARFTPAFDARLA